MLDQAFDALTTYDWGTDPNVLKPIDEAVLATYGDADARKQLETRLAGALKTAGEAAAPAASFKSAVVTRQTPDRAVPIDFDITGAKQLYLVVTDGGNGNACDWAAWANPRLVGDAGERKLTEIDWRAASSQWGTAQVNHNIDGGALKINGKEVEYGIGTHASSEIAFDLPPGYTRFKATAGLDDGGCAEHASVQFAVYTQKPFEHLAGDVSRNVNDYICRKLRVIGTASSVPALAELLSHKDYSHMARYALERIPAPEAAKAMRDALPKLDAQLQVGVISSLGVRQDEQSVAPLANLLAASDVAVARAAAFALGDIRSPTAAKALANAKPTPDVKSAATDASLACAEGLLADGKKTEALMIYKGLASGDQPKHVRLAATRGMLACAGKQG